MDREEWVMNFKYRKELKFFLNGYTKISMIKKKNFILLKNGTNIDHKYIE